MVNAHVVVIVHVNSSTQKLINLSTYSPLQREGLGGEAPRQLVYSSTKKNVTFFDKRNSQNRKNGGAFDALSHEWRDAAIMFSAC